MPKINIFDGKNNFIRRYNVKEHLHSSKFQYKCIHFFEFLYKIKKLREHRKLCKEYFPELKRTFISEIKYYVNNLRK